MYEWDENKARMNLIRHGVDFDHAEVFDWETAQAVEDTRKDYGEARFVAYGTIWGRLHVMVYTLRKNKIRIIGLRKANNRERRFYDDNT